MLEIRKAKKWSIKIEYVVFLAVIYNNVGISN